MRRTLLIMAACLALAATGNAEEAPADQKGPPKAETPEARSSSTQHAIRIDGQAVKYTATAGWLILKNDKGEPTARFGYTAYTRDGVSDLSLRQFLL